MKKLLTLALAVCALALVSCGPSRYTSSSVNLASIDEFAFVEPLAYITYTNDQNEPFYDPDLSRQAAGKIETIISSERYPFSDVIKVDYDEEGTLRKWVSNLSDVDVSRAERLRVPNKLENLIKDSGHRYGIVIYSFGYIQSAKAREYERMKKSVRRLVDHAIEKITEKKVYSSASDTYMSSPYGNSMYCAIIDAEKGQIVHFVEEIPFLASHPIDGSDVNERLRSMLKEFYK